MDSDSNEQPAQPAPVLPEWRGQQSEEQFMTLVQTMGFTMAGLLSPEETLEVLEHLLVQQQALNGFHRVPESLRDVCGQLKECYMGMLSATSKDEFMTFVLAAKVLTTDPAVLAEQFNYGQAGLQDWNSCREYIMTVVRETMTRLLSRAAADEEPEQAEQEEEEEDSEPDSRESQLQIFLEGGQLKQPEQAAGAGVKYAEICTEDSEVSVMEASFYPDVEAHQEMRDRDQGMIISSKVKNSSTARSSQEALPVDDRDVQKGMHIILDNGDAKAIMLIKPMAREDFVALAKERGFVSNEQTLQRGQDSKTLKAWIWVPFERTSGLLGGGTKRTLYAT